MSKQQGTYYLTNVYYEDSGLLDNIIRVRPGIVMHRFLREGEGLGINWVLLIDWSFTDRNVQPYWDAGFASVRGAARAALVFTDYARQPRTYGGKILEVELIRVYYEGNPNRAEAAYKMDKVRRYKLVTVNGKQYLDISAVADLRKFANWERTKPGWGDFNDPALGVPWTPPPPPPQFGNPADTKPTEYTWDNARPKILQCLAAATGLPSCVVDRPW